MGRNRELALGIKLPTTTFSHCQQTFNAAAVGIHGAGWCWLGYNRATERLEIATCANQDPLEATTGEGERIGQGSGNVGYKLFQRWSFPKA